MENKKKFSIVIPVYNVEKYLEACLDSILKQSYKNFEIICINDGSTDNSLSILEKYRSDFNDCKIISQSNKGLSETRNLGMDQANAEYIVFVDSDDMLREDALESINTILEKNKLDLVFYDGINYDEESKKSDHNRINRANIYKKNIMSRDEFLIGAINKSITAVQFHCYNLEFLKQKKLRFKKDLLHEDELFSIQCYKELNLVGYINEKLYVRRYRPNSIMSSNLYENKKSLKSYLYILDVFRDIKNSDNSLISKFASKRGSLIINNLIRYQDVSIKQFIKYLKEFKFPIQFKRIVANYAIYKIYRRYV